MLRKSNNVTIRRCKCVGKSTLIILASSMGKLPKSNYLGLYYTSRDEMMSVGREASRRYIKYTIYTQSKRYIPNIQTHHNFSSNLVIIIYMFVIYESFKTYLDFFLSMWEVFSKFTKCFVSKYRQNF